MGNINNKSLANLQKPQECDELPEDKPSSDDEKAAKVIQLFFREYLQRKQTQVPEILTRDIEESSSKLQANIVPDGTKDKQEGQSRKLSAKLERSPAIGSSDADTKDEMYTLLKDDEIIEAINKLDEIPQDTELENTPIAQLSDENDTKSDFEISNNSTETPNENSSKPSESSKSKEKEDILESFQLLNSSEFHDTTLSLSKLISDDKIEDDFEIIHTSECHDAGLPISKFFEGKNSEENTSRDDFDDTKNSEIDIPKLEENKIENDNEISDQADTNQFAGDVTQYELMENVIKEVTESELMKNVLKEEIKENGYNNNYDAHKLRKELALASSDVQEDELNESNLPTVKNISYNNSFDAEKLRKELSLVTDVGGNEEEDYKSNQDYKVSTGDLVYNNKFDPEKLKMELESMKYEANEEVIVPKIESALTSLSSTFDSEKLREELALAANITIQNGEKIDDQSASSEEQKVTVSSEELTYNNKFDLEKLRKELENSESEEVVEDDIKRTEVLSDQTYNNSFDRDKLRQELNGKMAEKEIEIKSDTAETNDHSEEMEISSATYRNLYDSEKLREDISKASVLLDDISEKTESLKKDLIDMNKGYSNKFSLEKLRQEIETSVIDLDGQTEEKAAETTNLLDDSKRIQKTQVALNSGNSVEVKDNMELSESNNKNECLEISDSNLENIPEPIYTEESLKKESQPLMGEGTLKENVTHNADNNLDQIKKKSAEYLYTSYKSSEASTGKIDVEPEDLKQKEREVNHNEIKDVLIGELESMKDKQSIDEGLNEEAQKSKESFKTDISSDEDDGKFKINEEDKSTYKEQDESEYNKEDKSEYNKEDKSEYNEEDKSKNIDDDNTLEGTNLDNTRPVSIASNVSTESAATVVLANDETIPDEDIDMYSADYINNDSTGIKVDDLKNLTESLLQIQEKSNLISPVFETIANLQNIPKVDPLEAITRDENDNVKGDLKVEIANIDVAAPEIVKMVVGDILNGFIDNNIELESPPDDINILKNTEDIKVSEAEVKGINMREVDNATEPKEEVAEYNENQIINDNKMSDSTSLKMSSNSEPETQENVSEINQPEVNKINKDPMANATEPENEVIENKEIKTINDDILSNSINLEVKSETETNLETQPRENIIKDTEAKINKVDTDIKDKKIETKDENADNKDIGTINNIILSNSKNLEVMSCNPQTKPEVGEVKLDKINLNITDNATAGKEENIENNENSAVNDNILSDSVNLELNSIPENAGTIHDSDRNHDKNSNLDEGNSNSTRAVSNDTNNENNEKSENIEDQLPDDHKVEPDIVQIVRNNDDHRVIGNSGLIRLDTIDLIGIEQSKAEDPVTLEDILQDTDTIKEPLPPSVMEYIESCINPLGSLPAKEEEVDLDLKPDNKNLFKDNLDQNVENKLEENTNNSDQKYDSEENKTKSTDENKPKDVSNESISHTNKTEELKNVTNIAEEIKNGGNKADDNKIEDNKATQNTNNDSHSEEIQMEGIKIETDKSELQENAEKLVEVNITESEAITASLNNEEPDSKNLTLPAMSHLQNESVPPNFQNNLMEENGIQSDHLQSTLENCSSLEKDTSSSSLGQNLPEEKLKFQSSSSSNLTESATRSTSPNKSTSDKDTSDTNSSQEISNPIIDVTNSPSKLDADVSTVTSDLDWSQSITTAPLYVSVATAQIDTSTEPLVPSIDAVRTSLSNTGEFHDSMPTSIIASSPSGSNSPTSSDASSQTNGSNPVDGGMHDYAFPVTVQVNQPPGQVFVIIAAQTNQPEALPLSGVSLTSSRM